MNKFIAYLIVILVVIIVVGSASGYFLLHKNTPKQAHPTACTMEAKICPDGTTVGREGPNCEFKACPVVKIQLSGIKGIAMLGPMCPVQKNPPDPKCADRPYKTNLIITSRPPSQIVKSFSSGTDGRFSVDLPPGEYAISSADTASIFSHCSSQGSIKVENNKYADVTINCDTGIR
jgi:hypothetical protein